MSIDQLLKDTLEGLQETLVPLEGACVSIRIDIDIVSIRIDIDLVSIRIDIDIVVYYVVFACVHLI